MDARNQDRCNPERQIGETECNIRSAIELINKGHVTRETLSILEDIRGLGKRFDTVAALFPFENFFALIQEIDGVMKQYALVIFALYAQSDAFPTEAFISEDILAFLLQELATTRRSKVFSNVLRLMCKFMRTSEEARDWLLEAGILDTLSSFPDCRRIPYFLETVLVTGTVPDEIFSNIASWLQNLSDSESIEMVTNVLNTLTTLVSSSIPINYDWMVAKFDHLIELEDAERLQIALIDFMAVIPDVKVTYGTHFMQTLASGKHWMWLSHVLDLFIAKHTEWSGNVNDELLTVAFGILNSQENYGQTRKIAKILLLYLDFGDINYLEYILIAVDCILKFVSDQDLSGAVIENMMDVLTLELEDDEAAYIINLVNEAFNDIETLIIESDKDIADAAAQFLQAYEEWAEDRVV